MCPGDTADVKSLLTVVDCLRLRHGIQFFCILADQGMASGRPSAPWKVMGGYNV